MLTPALGTARRLFLSATLALGLAGCSAWREISLPGPGPVPAGDSGSTRAASSPIEFGSVRVERADGSTLDLLHARFEGDSLVGETRREALFGSGSRRVALARSDVSKIEVRHFSTWRSTLLFALIATGGGLALRVLFGAFGAGASD